MKIYLAGAIGGCSYEEATQWRIWVAGQLGERFTCLDPMDGKDVLAQSDCIGLQYPGVECLSSQSITEKDLERVRRCDCVLAYMVGDRRFVGTLIEIGYAAALGKKIIVVSDRDWVWQHPFIETLTNVRLVSGLDYKLDLIAAIHLLGLIYPIPAKLNPLKVREPHQLTEE